MPGADASTDWCWRPLNWQGRMLVRGPQQVIIQTIDDDIPGDASYCSPDWNHLNVTGLAALARFMWPPLPGSTPCTEQKPIFTAGGCGHMVINNL